MLPNPSRRSVLAAFGASALAVGLVGCTDGSTTVPVPSRTSADDQARSTAAAVEDALAIRATGTAQRHPALTEAARAGRVHAEHAQALRAGVQASPAASGSTAASPDPTAAAIPPSPARAAAELAAAQRAASAAHRLTLTGPDITGDLARLLGSVAASDSAFARATELQGAPR